MWGILPAAGVGSRIQPLGFSKELLPIGSCIERTRVRPKAVSEYLVDRLITGGATKICFIISPHKTDIIEYFGAGPSGVHISYVVQPQPAGLCDSLFRALPLISSNESVTVALPDTVWFPADALRQLPATCLSLLLFPVSHPERFDSVVTDDIGRVQRVDVKTATPRSEWVWGAFTMPGAVYRSLSSLWERRDRADEYFGTLINAYLEDGGAVEAVRAGRAYVDVGTVNGYHEALQVVASHDSASPPDARVVSALP